MAKLCKMPYVIETGWSTQKTPSYEADPTEVAKGFIVFRL